VRGKRRFVVVSAREYRLTLRVRDESSGQTVVRTEVFDVS
jgi:hypothetical protein